LLRGTAGERVRCDDDIDLETNQFADQGRISFHLRVRRPDLYGDVLAIDIAEFA
jgi:hypothetical protein